MWPPSCWKVLTELRSVDVVTERRTLRPASRRVSTSGSDLGSQDPAPRTRLQDPSRPDATAPAVVYSKNTPLVRS